ncbi:MAG: N-acetylmuramoyl-L-alanine amidase [Rhodospirillaceae bacterium]|nr:N-acetylmuramoyl-L-alanine amidase [Rhodospirillaceae bacterium]
MGLTPAEFSSPNFNDRPKDIIPNILVIHYTGMQSLDQALQRLMSSNSQVSAHYLISRKGEIFKLVSEEKRAWHAGVSYWRGETDINSYSIGIELENPGHEFGYSTFPKGQMSVLTELCVEVINKYSISPENIVGHSDIAPRRKKDPGELFDWKSLAKKGVGLWPEPILNKITLESFEKSLNDFGYEVVDLRSTITAFQRHYLPDTVSGIADVTTQKTLATLMSLV